jgi:hypothetical protein
VKSASTFPNERSTGVVTYVIVEGIARFGQTQSCRTKRYACQRRWSATKNPTSQDKFVKARRAVAPVLASVWIALMRYTAVNAFPLFESGTSPTHLGLRFLIPGSAYEREE